MELEADEQVVEFDSSSSSSSSSDEVGSEEEQGNEDGDISSTEGEQTPTNGGKRASRRKRKRAPNLRRELRAKFDSLDDFNPEAKSAQSEELERIRRLELQQSITDVSQIPVVSSAAPSSLNPPPSQPPPPPFPSSSSSSSSSTAFATELRTTSASNVVTVDLTSVVAEPQQSRAAPINAIVIDSDSDNDSDYEKPASKRPKFTPAPPSSSSSSSAPTEAVKAKRVDLLARKYDGVQTRPDGRVLVNFGHGPDEGEIFLSPNVARVAKPHQIGGIRFLYDNIIESQSRFTSSSGFGCILAHSMGLGKTLQVIGFIDIFLRFTPAKHVLCVVPVNTLQNWINEFDKWLPAAAKSKPKAQSTAPSVPNLPGKTTQGISLSTLNSAMSHFDGRCTATADMLSAVIDQSQWTTGTPQQPAGGVAGGSGLEESTRTFEVFVLSENTRTMDARKKVIANWRAASGVLLIGYEMFRLLSLSIPLLGGNKMAVKRKKNNSGRGQGAGLATIDLEENEREMESLISIQQALCSPGADLIVCDEGHRIKNDYTNISQALKRIKTSRRIVLTGYPLQNNLLEYWCMVDFVRPKYLGTKQEFSDLFERPITNGQCMDSTPADVRLMRYRSHVLHTLLEGFVLRRGHEVLQASLPAKFEHVLFLRLSPVQETLYNYNMALIQSQGDGPTPSSAGPLKAFAVCSKIWNHPDIYYREAKAQDAKRVSPTSWLDEAGLPKSLLTPSSSSSSSSSSAKAGNGDATSMCKIEWPSFDFSGSSGYQTGLLEHSPKMAVLCEVVDRSVQLGEKVLIFSQSLSSLSFVEKMLEERPIPVPNSFNPGTAVQYGVGTKWMKNRNFCRLDGSTGSVERDRLINLFNSAANTECWVFLLSTKAGCLGINLVGANRVVVLDVSWNPCYDAQAVCRVYRYGQNRPCYIYRLVSDGTMERKMYDRQISKQGMSDRVVDELQPERHINSQDILTLIGPLAQLPSPADLSPNAHEFFFDPVLTELCKTHGHLFTKLPFKHESLLADSAEERMTEVEKYLALKGFQQEWKAMRTTANYRARQNSSVPQQTRPQFPPPPSALGPAGGGGGGVAGGMPLSSPSSAMMVRPAPRQQVGMIPPHRAPKLLPPTVVSSSRTNQQNSSEKVEIICLDSDDEEEKNGGGTGQQKKENFESDKPGINSAEVPAPVAQSQYPPVDSSSESVSSIPASLSSEVGPTQSGARLHGGMTSTALASAGQNISSTTASLASLRSGIISSLAAESSQKITPASHTGQQQQFAGNNGGGFASLAPSLVNLLAASMNQGLPSVEKSNPSLLPPFSSLPASSSLLNQQLSYPQQQQQQQQQQPIVASGSTGEDGLRGGGIAATQSSSLSEKPQPSSLLQQAAPTSSEQGPSHSTSTKLDLTSSTSGDQQATTSSSCSPDIIIIEDKDTSSQHQQQHSSSSSHSWQTSS